jgi:hypothetical protein
VKRKVEPRSAQRSAFMVTWVGLYANIGGTMNLRRRPHVWVPLALVAAFLVVRAVIEPFQIDPGDPATFQNDWGGPSYLGVLAVHSGPGVLVLVGAATGCGAEGVLQRRHPCSLPSRLAGQEPISQTLDAADEVS